MTPSSVPIQDRASLSERTRDHQHKRHTTFKRRDWISLACDVLFAFAGVLVVGGICSMTAFGFFETDKWVPRAVEGPPQYEPTMWLVFTGTTVLGMWGLIQFWLRRIWVETYGSRASVWSGALAIQILVGAIMPICCVLWLMAEGLLVSFHAAFFIIVAALYIRHSVQVFSWSGKRR